MKSLNSFIRYKIAVGLIALSFVSCSKENENSSENEITVTTADFSKTMDENPANGRVIGTVSGSTNEGTISFSITEQTPSGAFSIDATSGELKVADETLFDFETNPIITGTVKVASGAVSKNAVVKITLNDVTEDNVYNGGIQLFTQEEVNDFGANNYTHITKQLLIGKLDNSPSSIHDLSPLNTLKSIGTTFIIIDNPLLINLNGLENLEFIGYNFAIIDNPALSNIQALSKLTSLNDYLSIDGNDQLLNLEGLENINSIQTNLSISSNYSLENINLPRLSSVGGNITITDNLTLQDFNLQNLTNVNGNLMVLHNKEITNLDGLSGLTSIEGDLYIQLNYLLQNFCSLSNVFIGGHFNGQYSVWGNEYDPTQQDLINGNCSL
jgi:hypothetical protein